MQNIQMVKSFKPHFQMDIQPEQGITSGILVINE